jgi:hypothetical protein
VSFWLYIHLAGYLVCLLSGVWLLCRYVDDPRNTDHAWMETAVVHYHLSDEQGSVLVFDADGAGGGAGEAALPKPGAVKWLDIDDGNPEYLQLSFNHLDFAEKCRQRLQFEQVVSARTRSKNTARQPSRTWLPAST